jgi:hypothetical protein
MVISDSIPEISSRLMAVVGQALKLPIDEIIVDNMK